MDYRNCTAGVYHSFTVIDSPYTNGAKVQREKCQYCGKAEEYTFTPDGKMTDERQYFLDHIRAFAQPVEDDLGMMEAFLACNPNAAARMTRDAAQEKKSEDHQAELTELFHWSMKRALDDKGWEYKKDGVDYSSKEK